MGACIGRTETLEPLKNVTFKQLKGVDDSKLELLLLKFL